MRLSKLAPALALPALFGLALAFAAPTAASAAVAQTDAAPIAAETGDGLTRVADRWGRGWRGDSRRGRGWRWHQPRRTRFDAGRAHVRWCFERFRSYDLRTNTYFGFDRRHHECVSPYSGRRWRRY